MDKSAFLDTNPTDEPTLSELPLREVSETESNPSAVSMSLARWQMLDAEGKNFGESIVVDVLTRASD